MSRVRIFSNSIPMSVRAAKFKLSSFEDLFGGADGAAGEQLDSDNGIGLIEKNRRGLGKPDIISRVECEAAIIFNS